MADPAISSDSDMILEGENDMKTRIDDALPPARRLCNLLGMGGVLSLTMVAAGCSDLLGVNIPGAVAADDLDNPALARTQVVAALGEFECSYVQFATTAGIFTEEFRSSSSRRNTNVWNSRLPAVEDPVGGCSGSRDADSFGYWAPMQVARGLAEDGYERISNFAPEEVPNHQRKLADLSLYEGYAYTILAEGYCGVTANAGPLISREQAFGIAEQLFTRAIGHAQSAANDDIVMAATMGRARARLNQGDLQGAASDAAMIPAGFQFDVNYSEAQIRRENRWHHVTDNRRLTVGDDYIGLTVDGVPDTRVPVADSDGAGEDAVTPFYLQLKVTSRGQNLPLASWVEAQLILAEANAGTAVAVAALENVRDHFGLPPYTGNGNLDDIIEERRRTFFMEGHRLNDMLRHGIPFPTGISNKGDTYGPYTCIPIPTNEQQNNPNI